MSPPALPRTRRLPRVEPTLGLFTLLVCTTLAAAATIRFGAAPGPRPGASIGEYFTDPSLAIHDTRDRWWFFVHLVALGIGLLASSPSARSVIVGRTHDARTESLTRISSWCTCVILGLCAMRVLPSEPLIPGLGWRVPAGVLVAAAFTTARGARSWLLAPRWSRVTTLFLLTLAFLATLQTPTNVVDTNHLVYSVDELLASVAGRWPGSDYVAQYSYVAPWLTGGIRWLFGDHVESLTIVVVVALSCATILAGFVLATRCLGRQRPALAALVFLPWPVLSTGFLLGGERAAAFLQAGSARPLLPVLIGLVVATRTRPGIWDVRRSLIFGVLLAVCLYNNLDFGGPAVAAVAVVMLMDARWRSVRVIGAVCLGALGSLTAIAISYATLGHSLRLATMTLMIQLHGTLGFQAVPMPVYGLHTLIAIIFLATAVVGSWRLRTATESRHTDVGRIALYVGAWSLFSLPYFVGRSLVANLLIVYAINIGLCLCALLAMALDTPRKTGSDNVLRPVRYGILGLAVAAWMMYPNHVGSLERVGRAGTGETHDLVRVLDLDGRAARLESSVRSLQDEAGFISVAGNALQLRTGFANANYYNNVGWITVGPHWAGLQCEHLAETGLDVVLVEDPAVAAALVGNAECADALDRTSARLLDTGWTAIDLRRGGS